MVNMSEVLNSLPLHIVERFESLVLILGAVGIAFIVYVIYVVVKMVLGFKHSNRLKILIKKVDSLEGKIDTLIKNKKEKDKGKKKNKK